MLSFQTMDQNTHPKSVRDSADCGNCSTEHHQHQSNGKVESAVKMAKRLLTKAKATGRTPYLALLDHLNTPSQGLDTNPAQRLLSCCTSTLLPAKNSLVLPKVTQAQQDPKTKQQMCDYYNSSKGPCKAETVWLCEDTPTPLQPHSVWRLVLRSVDSRSYEVQLDTGGILRRNRRNLQLTQEQDIWGPIITRILRSMSQNIEQNITLNAPLQSHKRAANTETCK